jgi:hypothetical protein
MDDSLKCAVLILVKDAASKSKFLEERSDAQLVDSTIPFAMIHEFIVDYVDERCAELQIDTSTSHVGRAIADLVSKSPLGEFLAIDRVSGHLKFSDEFSRSDRIELANYLISITGSIS